LAQTVQKEALVQTAHPIAQPEKNLDTPIPGIDAEVARLAAVPEIQAELT